MTWGETVAQAAEREVAEEAGIACRVLDSSCPAFTATDAIYLSEGFHYVVVHVLAATSDPAPTLLYLDSQDDKLGALAGVAAPAGPLHCLPPLQAGDDAADVAWVAIDCLPGDPAATSMQLLPAKGGTRVVRLSDLMKNERVVPMTPAVLHKARLAMEAHLVHQGKQEE